MCCLFANENYYDLSSWTWIHTWYWETLTHICTRATSILSFSFLFTHMVIVPTNFFIFNKLHLWDVQLLKTCPISPNKEAMWIYLIVFRDMHATLFFYPHTILLFAQFILNLITLCKCLSSTSNDLIVLWENMFMTLHPPSSLHCPMRAYVI